LKSLKDTFVVGLPFFIIKNSLKLGQNRYIDDLSVQVLLLFNCAIRPK